MKLLIRYCRENLFLLLLGCAMHVILIGLYLLYEFPLDAILYPILLCDGIAMLYALIRFFRYRSHYIVLSRILEPDEVPDDVYPKAVSGIEEELYRIICSLQSSLLSIKEENEQAQRDMIDYYTVWVHQIKTPIAAMKLHLENEESELSGKMQADLFHIEQYVEMVLAYLRISSDETDYCFRQYDIDTLLKKVIRRYAAEFIERNLSMDYKPVNMHAVTDEKWLCFVFEQVLSNALKYTPSGTISIYAYDEDTICIEDTGIGIAPEDLPRIFENGFTGYNGRLSPQASGLGLYLCKKICRELNHDIRAESTLNKGTKILISLHRNTHLTQS